MADIEKEEFTNDPMNEDMFDGLKKKKKKKSKTEDDADVAPETDAVDDAMNEDPEQMFADLKKKKKKKSKSEDGTEAVEATVEDEGMDSAFAGKKKKKKRPDLAEFEAQMSAEKDESGTPVGKEHGGAGSTGVAADVDDSERDFTYEELLARFYKLIRENNPELAGEKKKYIIVPPAVSREGSKKTAFSNLIDICKRMRRNPDHVVQFLFTELGTTGSIDGSQRLVIKGRFQQKQIENLLKRYIVEYVTCKTCKSADTTLSKENRLYFVKCESCGSSRTVSAIKSGFMAQTGKRAAQRTE